jgi:hypothetical protein
MLLQGRGAGGTPSKKRAAYLELPEAGVRLADALYFQAAGLLLPARGVQLLGKGRLLGLLKGPPASLQGSRAREGLHGLFTRKRLNVKLAPPLLYGLIHFRRSSVYCLLGGVLYQVLTLVLGILGAHAILLTLLCKETAAVGPIVFLHCCTPMQRAQWGTLSFSCVYKPEGANRRLFFFFFFFAPPPAAAAKKETPNSQTPVCAVTARHCGRADLRRCHETAGGS